MQLTTKHKTLCYAIAISTISLIFNSCNKDAMTPATTSEVNSTSCKGIYLERNQYGELKKYNEFFNSSTHSCLIDSVELTQWEKTSDTWNKNSVTCTPQPQFSSITALSANNFYSYRNNRIYLDLDASTGIYRKITLGEDVNGNSTFTRLQGCFYQRTGIGVDTTFGDQILFDTEVSKIKTSEVFDPMEIFKYTISPSSLEMVRFDSSSDWDYTFCPALNTPWEFCNDMRNGNIIFYPVLTDQQMVNLLNEALLIRKQFNFTKITNSQFELLWQNVEKNNYETGRTNWKYMVTGIVDTPKYIDQAWREYVMGLRPHMPDMN